MCAQEKREATLEYEMAVRELRRKRGDVVTILSESLPITIIQVPLNPSPLIETQSLNPNLNQINLNSAHHYHPGPTKLNSKP